MLLVSPALLMLLLSPAASDTFEQETRRMFVQWKAKYKKTYRDVGEEECRYMLFKGNRRVVVDLNAAAAGKTAYGLNQFGDLTKEEVRESCDGGMEGKLSALCQAAVAGYAGVHHRPIRSQVIIILLVLVSFFCNYYGFLFFFLVNCSSFGIHMNTSSALVGRQGNDYRPLHHR